MQATAEWLDTNYYDILGVAEDATAKQIKSAYRTLARTAHPDANPDDPSAEQRFSDIAKAYEVLGDDDTRAEYDNLRLQAQRQPFDSSYGAWSGQGQHQGYGDLHDLFGDLFAQQASRPRRGGDITATLTMDFRDAVNGLTTSLMVDGRDLKVRIPAGVDDGQTIRLAGKGAPGVNGGPAGDLLIRIDVIPDRQFDRQGRNLTVRVPVRYDDAVLGADIVVPTLNGPSVTVRVPPCTQDGAKLRVRGKGVPGSAAVGDLLVTICIDIPQTVSSEERELLEQIRALRHPHAA